jgi:GT2 family glycosyltransferase
MATDLPIAPQSTGKPLPTLSIVICTHDRPSDVSDCLQSLMPQLAGSTTELIITDSASSPDKRRLLAEVVAQYATVKLMRVEETGSSLARNVGIAATASEWVAFLDDDAVPAPDWHEQLQRVLASVPADCGAIGGRILPLFPDGSSPQLGSRWRMYVSLNEADGERDCTEHFGLISANCAFRRRALDEAGGFPTGLGRFGQSLLSGEDVLLMRRVRSHGWRIRYHSQFSVGHKVKRERLTRRWVRSRAFWEGITTVRMARIEQDRSWIRLAIKVGVSLPLVSLGALLSPHGEWDLRCFFNMGVLLETFGFSPGQQPPGGRLLLLARLRHRAPRDH